MNITHHCGYSSYIEIMSRAERSRKWTFTLNCKDKFDKFQSRISSLHEYGNVTYYKFQEEIAPTTGRFHLQGVVYTKEHMTLSALKKKLEERELHLEIARDWSAACDYVTKAETATGKYINEAGKCPSGVPHRPSTTIQRTFKDCVDHGYSSVLQDALLMQNENSLDILDHHEKIQKLMRMREQAQLKEELRHEALENAKKFYPWQKKLQAILDGPAHDRHVYWIWEPSGNTGKSFFRMNYMNMSDGRCVLLENGRSNDMLLTASQTPGRKTIFLDLPRTVNQVEDINGVKSFVNYSAIEQLKNGSFTSNKYYSQLCVGRVPHFIIFANFEPKLDNTLSEDRFIIWKIVDKQKDPEVSYVKDGIQISEETDEAINTLYDRELKDLEPAKRYLEKAYMESNRKRARIEKTKDRDY